MAINVSATTHHELEASSIDQTDNTTDVVYQDIEMFIEGVQVPIMSCVISQSMGQLPVASISIPPSPGLMDIIRYYQPKVHIFYSDAVYGGSRLLFTGHAVSNSFSLSTSNASISFDCAHKNALVNQVSIDYSGYMTETTTDPNSTDATVKPGVFSSQESILLALAGINGIQTDPNDLLDSTNQNVSQAKTSLLDATLAKFEKRFAGMPATLINLWNQFKKECYTNVTYNTMLDKVHIPLLENGIHFFDRISGHYMLEKIIQGSKIDPCVESGNPGNYEKVMLPPAARLKSMSAIQSSITLAVSSNSQGYSGQYAGFLQLMQEFLYSIEYELITLASPASVAVDPEVDGAGKDVERMAIETVIKPQLPFYFSPVCNVLLPNMWMSMSASQSENDVPTRITVTCNVEGKNVSYRAPGSIRESVALGVSRNNSALAKKDPSRTFEPVDLASTTSASYNIPGKYELGRGFNPKHITAPDWLSMMIKDQSSSGTIKDREDWPTDNSSDGKDLLDANLAWLYKYGYDGKGPGRTRNHSKDVLDPYSKKANILPYQRMLFAAADYDFTKSVLSTRSGSVACLFNPYIVPGYPMELVAKSPNHPSFHAVCASVTHNITSDTITTTVGFVGAATYSELVNYQMTPVHPWLQSALKLVNVARDSSPDKATSEDVIASSAVSDAVVSTPGQTEAQTKLDTYAAQVNKINAVASNSIQDVYGLAPNPEYDTNTGKVIRVDDTLINNPRALAVASKFYMSVFGVGAAAPSDLIDMSTGELQALKRVGGLLLNGGPTASIKLPNGGEGNDNLTGVGNLRMISRLIESKNNMIEKNPNLGFIDLTENNYGGTQVSYENPNITDPMPLEPGASLFLDYPEIPDFLSNYK